ncbi:MAG: 3-oxoacyl-ACP reductase FabG [Clostridia bacterium]|nr:3-oxoacyl-ACP reductase FabG [Clostridia bacterium]
MKIALITGASGGIGRETALTFLNNGYFVVAQYNTGTSGIEQLKRLAKERGVYDYLFTVKADLSKVNEIEDMMDKVDKSFKRIDVLVNNAGVSLNKLVTDTTESDYDKVFSVNMKSAFLLTNRVLKGMISAKKGKIVNVSSMWGVVGASMEVAYSASKSALIGYTKALAKEVGLSGINVNCVCPGVIDTPMNANLTKDDVIELKKQTPIGRIGTPKDIAELILFLSSDKSDFITGQIITVDGGLTL